MNRYIKFLIFPVLILIMWSCEDEDTVRFDMERDIEDAVNLRVQLDEEYSLLNATDLDAAKLQYDMFTENEDIEVVNLYIEYYNFAQDSTYERRRIKQYSQQDFDAEGVMRDESITPQEIADLYSIDVATIGGGDRIDLLTEVHLDDGRVYPDTVLKGTDHEALNVPAGIVNAPTTSFTYKLTTYVACEVPEGYATGTYLLEQIAGPADPFFGGATRWETEEVTVTQVSPIERQLSGTYFTFSVNLNFLLVCGNVLVPVAGAGIGCTSELAFSGAATPATYDETDDSVIIIELFENALGDCGLPVNEPLTLRLTKL